MPDPRALLAAVYRAAVEGADPFVCTHQAVSRWLAAHRDLTSARPKVRVFGMGKASLAMTSGAVAALHYAGLDPQHGVVVSATGTTPQSGTLPPEFVIVHGDHPVPGPNSLAAGDAIENAVRDVQANDIAIVLLSGGTTSLAAAPVAALSLAVGDAERAQAHLANLADTLLESGLAIHEMNAIRRRMLRWGAGRLAVALSERGASHIAVFAISDVIGDDPTVIGSGPCTADPLDEPSFLALLDAHGVRQSLQRDTAVFLGVAGSGRPPAVPISTHDAFARVDYEIVARNHDALVASEHAGENAGVTHVLVESTVLEGEAAPLGDIIARHAIACAQRLPRGESALLLYGGEPVVHLRATYERAWADSVDDESGLEADPALLNDIVNVGAFSPIHHSPSPHDDEPMLGGRMQVLALSAALALEEVAGSGDDAARTATLRITILAAGTDGRDGPTDAAGAIVDAITPMLARRAGRRPERDLSTGRSWFPLDAASALLRTGPTGTNVMDVVAVFISQRP